MLGIVISRADSASVHIGEHLRNLTDWETAEDESVPDGDGGGTVWRTDGATLREFDELHLHLDRPAEAFSGPTLLVFASRHSGETGPLLTAHHTGNAGPADHGGRANEFARACPNAHAHVIDRLDAYAPEGYAVGMECTHHGPSAVGAPSMFVEVGSEREQWDDPAAARAVARAILDLRGVAPDRPVEDSPGVDESTGDWTRRHLVGLGGGHYVPRFERVVRETDWAVGHIVADWGLEAVDESDREVVLEQAFEQSRAAYALVDGDRPDIEAAVEACGHRPVSETWVRETDGVPLTLVQTLEGEVGTVENGLRFGTPASNGNPPDEWTVETIGDVLDEAFGIDHERTRGAVADHALAFDTTEGGTRPTGTIVLGADEDGREQIIEELLGVLNERYDHIERENGTVFARETAFDAERARTLGVPEGPAFGRLASGERVDVDGETIPPEAVTRERERRFTV